MSPSECPESPNPQPPMAETPVHGGYGECPRCRNRTLTEDRIPNGAHYRLCLDPDCGFSTEEHVRPVGLGRMAVRQTSEEIEFELERTVLESEVRLQSLRPEDIHGDAPTLREFWQQTGHVEEFEEILESLAHPSHPEPEDLVARRASAELFRALSVARAGPRRPAGSST